MEPHPYLLPDFDFGGMRLFLQLSHESNRIIRLYYTLNKIGC
ncbi:unnamed protein product [Rhodiola kirilowii]